MMRVLKKIPVGGRLLSTNSRSLQCRDLVIDPGEGSGSSVGHLPKHAFCLGEQTSVIERSAVIPGAPGCTRRLATLFILDVFMDIYVDAI